MSTVFDSIEIDGGGWIDTRDCAKLVRLTLKREFPTTKFGVRIDRYAGGSAVNVSWKDGPTEDQVRQHVGVYGSKGFDGMIDLSYSYDAWLLPDGSAHLAHTSGTQGSMGSVPEQFGSPMHPDAKKVRFGASYVSLYRDYTDEATQKVRDEITAVTGIEWDGSDHRVEVPWRTYVDDDGEMKLSHDPQGYTRNSFGTLVHQIVYRRDLR